MGLSAGDIENLIRTGIPGADVTVSDLRGDNNHYAAHVISETFQGLSRVEQHRMVYAVLEGHMDDELQALAIQTAVPTK